MNNEQLETRVLNYIDKEHLINPGEKILVAVSGGPDSVFLLHFLNSHRKPLNIKLIVCHINHNIRRNDALADERFVRHLSSAMRIPFIAKNIEVIPYREKYQLSLEDAARALRLRTLIDTADKKGAQKIALGHTTDDAVETLFLNIIRGTGMDGIIGMQPKRDRFIRPLLCITKREIVTYLKSNSIQYRIDVTNWLEKYRRNFIRHTVVPLINKKLHISLEKKISQLREVLKGEDEVLKDITRKAKKDIVWRKDKDLFIKREGFRKQKIAIQRRLLLETFIDMGAEGAPNFRQIETLRTGIASNSSGMKFLFKGISILVGSKDALFRNYKDEGVQADFAIEKETILNVPSEIVFQNQYVIRTSLVNGINGDMKNHNCAYFDYDAIKSPIILRTRKDGDRFKPFGMNGEKKIKDFLIDEKVPPWQRKNIPLIEDANNILWIVGLRRADAARVNSDTKRILKITVDKIEK